MTLADHPSRPAEILLVEDSPTDALLTREALKFAKLKINLHHVEDGAEAMAFVRKSGKFQTAPRPDIVLLDLKLPKKDGHEVLREIKADADLNSIPVVVLTTSQHEADVLTAYNAHANCYIVKPVDFSKFVNIVQSIENFWFTIVVLPSETRQQTNS